MTTTDTPQPTVPPSLPSGEIVASAAKYYRMTRYFMVVLLFGYGLWSCNDGFRVWPQEREADLAKGMDPDHARHPGWDILFNRVLGVGLPPLSIVLLFYVLHKSRGEIRFDGKTLSAPGHPTVPLENIVSVDQRLWERKGIAYINYDLGDKRGSITLDDFIYDRPPTDAIHKAITEFIAPPETAASSSTPT